MSTTNTTSSLTEQIADLMRCKPAHGAPEHVRAAWIARKVELLHAVEAEQEANERTCSIDDAARTIGVERHSLHYSEALTTATAYAIQLGVDTGVQEGGQAPGVMLTNADYRHIVAAFEAGSEDATEQMIEAAEREGERPPAPAWWKGTRYPTCEQVSATGDPVRTFERDFDRHADRAWSAYMLVEDTLTAHGIDRSEPIIRAESHGDGLTITQARALAAALQEAADTAETI